MTDCTLLMRNVAAGYGDETIVMGFDLALGPGEGACLIGSNGCGKSTVLRTVLGLAKLHSGSIEILGNDPRRLPRHKFAASGISYVPQGRGDFPSLTVHENLRLAAAPKGTGEIAEACDQVYADIPSLIPLKRRPIRNLSGGERTLVALGRAIATGNMLRLLLLDEISAGLSLQNQALVARLLLRLREGGVSILASEQNLAFARSMSLPLVALPGQTQETFVGYDHGE